MREDFGLTGRVEIFFFEQLFEKVVALPSFSSQ